MKTTLMITALMIALAIVNTCKGAEESKPTHIVLIEQWRSTEHGYIIVCKSNGQPLGRVKVADWAEMLGRPMPKIGNDLRHLAVNAVAAVVAGNGGREHTIEPHAGIITIDESKTRSNENLYPVVTLERGTAFAIIRDTYTKSGYRAEIIAFPVDKSQLKGPPHRDESVRQEGAVA
jgi:hypothetical protein